MAPCVRTYFWVTIKYKYNDLNESHDIFIPRSWYYELLCITLRVSAIFRANYLLWDMFKAFDYTESSHESDVFLLQEDLFSFMRAKHVTI